MIELVVLAVAVAATSTVRDRPGLVRNRTEPTGKVMCRYCADDGLVVVWTRPVKPSPRAPRASGEMDEMGPCPFCEQGLRIEFPPADPKTGFQRVGPWGVNGFWGTRQELKRHLEPSWFPPEDKPRGIPHGLELPGVDAGLGGRRGMVDASSVPSPSVEPRPDSSAPEPPPDPRGGCDPEIGQRGDP